MTIRASFQMPQELLFNSLKKKVAQLVKKRGGEHRGWKKAQEIWHRFEEDGVREMTKAENRDSMNHPRCGDEGGAAGGGGRSGGIACDMWRQRGGGGCGGALPVEDLHCPWRWDDPQQCQMPRMTMMRRGAQKKKMGLPEVTSQALSCPALPKAQHATISDVACLAKPHYDQLMRPPLPLQVAEERCVYHKEMQRKGNMNGG